MVKLKLYKDNIKKNKKGDVFKYIEISNSFKKISEVYFSKIKKNSIKAWKKNKTSNQFFYIFDGKINLKIFDDRIKYKKKYNFILGRKSKYSKILIPKNVWYGFQGLEKNNVIVNSLSTFHKNCKMESLDINNNYIPIVWNKN
ncbi:hypothetical protein OAQ31_00085 [Candidatus Pelagibacter sp.]|nr:hypothetical protein [Candidatus Pelagibacter sp.]